MKCFFFICFAMAILFPSVSVQAGRDYSETPEVKPEMSVEIDEGTPKFIYQNRKVVCGLKGHSDGCTRVKFFAELKEADITPKGELKKIKLKIGFEYIEIELSSALQKGSCLFDATLKHELTHLALHRRILKRFAPEIAKAALSVAEEIEPPLTQIKFNRITRVIEDYLNRMAREDDRQNALMDSDSAYLHLTSQCLE